jgi:hypothetical protein
MGNLLAMTCMQYSYELPAVKLSMLLESAYAHKVTELQGLERL